MFSARCAASPLPRTSSRPGLVGLPPTHPSGFPMEGFQEAGTSWVVVAVVIMVETDQEAVELAHLDKVTTEVQV